MEKVSGQGFLCIFSLKSCAWLYIEVKGEGMEGKRRLHEGNVQSNERKTEERE